MRRKDGTPSKRHQKKVEQASRAAEAWNAKHPSGSAVVLIKDDGSEVATTTRSDAQVMPSGDAVIWLEGVTGCWLLARVRPAPTATSAPDLPTAGPLIVDAPSSPHPPPRTTRHEVAVALTDRDHAVERAYQRVHEWNDVHAEIGRDVIATKLDGSEVVTKTRSYARVFAGTAVIMLDAFPGAFPLSRVRDAAP